MALMRQGLKVLVSGEVPYVQNNISYHQGLSKVKEKFDVIISIFSTYTSSEPKIFELIASALKPGGVFIRVSGQNEEILDKTIMESLGLKLVNDYESLSSGSEARRVQVFSRLGQGQKGTQDPAKPREGHKEAEVVDRSIN